MKYKKINQNLNKIRKTISMQMKNLRNKLVFQRVFKEKDRLTKMN